MKVRASLGKRYFFGLTYESYEYLDDEDQCTHLSTIHQKQQFIINANFSSCQKRCTPYLLPIPDLPICSFNDSDYEARVCAYEALRQAYLDSEESGTYKRLCNINQYTGETIITEDTDAFRLVFGYKFAKPGLTIKYQEYLTFDPISLLGTIGGTLGIYIGFSCSGLFSRTLELVEDKYMGRNKEQTK